jgi:hypothetical protein
MSTRILFQNILTNILANNVSTNDIKYTLKDNKFHSENDIPAIETTTGIKAWFKDGALHRDAKEPSTGLTLPAFVKKGNCNEMLSEWWNNDVQHRDDIDPVSGKYLPAEIFICGESSYKCWKQNGVVHRPYKDGPAYINRYNEAYMENGLPHRLDDLPAVTSTDKREMEWWVEGKRDRSRRDENGKLLPAVVRMNGVEEYWVEGVRQH